MRSDGPEIKLGAAIRHARMGLGLSQESLADECGLHRTYISSVERGERNVSLKNIMIIAKALKLNGSQLLLNAGL